MADTNKDTITNCPQCPKGCPITEPHCPKGRAYAEQLNQEGYDIEVTEAHHEKHSHGEHMHEEHRKHRHHEQFDPDSLPGMMHRVGHLLFHGNPESVIDHLTLEEREQLKTLLGKMLKE